MKKLYNYFFLNHKKSFLILFFGIITVTNAQNKLVHFAEYTPVPTSVFPISQSPSNFNTSLISTATINYGGSVMTAKPTNARGSWDIRNTSTTLDPATAPYVEYTLNFNGSVNIDLNRFVINGASYGSLWPTNPSTKFELRWSVDNYATSLGLFSIGTDWQYRMTSVDLNPQSNFVGTQLKFRMYCYNSYNNESILSHVAPNGPYGSIDGTNSTYFVSNSVASIWINPPPPTISSFTPTSGAIGSPVVITGTDFTGATAVSFNGINATSFTVNSATQNTARVPAGATTGTIAVTTPSGTGTSSSSINIGGEVLLEYPFNNSLAPSIGTGSATITNPAAATLGSSSVCTDNLNNTGSFRTAAIPLSSFNVNAFQFDIDFSLPSLPTATSFLLNSSDLGRDFGLLVSPQGRLTVYYRASSVQDINSQLTNVQLVDNTNYNLSVQFIANTIRMRLNGNLVLVVDVADGIVIPTNPTFFFGDAYGAALSMRACIDNFRFIKDPLPFSFGDQLVVSPNAFSSFEACVNSP